MNASGDSETLDTIYLEEQTKAVFKHNSLLAEILGQQVLEKPEYVCRICLEICPNIKFCHCTGGMLTHHHCLTQFLTVKIKDRRLRKKQLRCEICQMNYEVHTDFHCDFSLKDCNSRICQNKFRCGLYSIFFLMVLLFFAYMGYLFQSGSTSNQTQMTLTIVAVCLSLTFFLMLGVWIYQYLFKISQGHISKVLSLDERKTRPNPSSYKVHPMPKTRQQITS